MAKANENNRGNNRNGSNWIRKDLRLAIYLRDNMTCVFCKTHADNTTLTLDHVVSRSEGGSNGTPNLVTACRSCNSSRQDMPIADFAARFDGAAQRVATAISTTRIEMVDYRNTAKGMYADPIEKAKIDAMRARASCSWKSEHAWRK